MLDIISLKVGSLQTNCYLVFDQKSKETVIIDPGDDAEYLKNIISQRCLLPRMILATHGHFDHILAAFDLQTSYNIPFLIHEADEFLVKKMQKSAKYYIKINSGPPPIIGKYLKDQDILSIWQSKIKIIHTPGHTPGSVCLYFPKEKWLFTGDTYFSEGIYGRTDFLYSSKNNLQKSLIKINHLIKKSSIYPGH